MKKIRQLIIKLLITYVTGSVSSHTDQYFDWLYNIQDQHNNKIIHEKSKICKTNECDILGKEFLKGMNESVNPCDDFYEFVCGGWKSNYKIPTYYYVWSRPLMFQHIVHRRLKEILEKTPTNNDILPLRQVKKWYHACMDIGALEKRGIMPIESILMQLGGWPMTIDYEEWDQDGHSWQTIEENYFYITGSYIFYDVDINHEKEDGLLLTVGELPLIETIEFIHRNYSGNDYKEYVDIIKQVVKMFVDNNKANVSTEIMNKDIEDMVNFEKKLNEIINFPYGFLNSHSQTIDEFIKQYDKLVNRNMDEGTIKINFRKLIKNKFNMINLKLNDTMLITVGKFNYFYKLTELLHNTPKRTIVNYLHWHFVSSMLTYTTDEIRDIYLRYDNEELGVSRKKPRWLECVSVTKLEIIKAYEFVKKYYSKRVEKTVRQMIEAIRSEMKFQILSSNWLDEETKNIIVDKLEDMIVYLGIPERFKNESFIVKFYKGLIIGNNHFDNALNYKKYIIKRKWRNAMVEKIIEPNEMNSLAINARYLFKENRIQLPAAIFQPPLFTPQLPSVVHYGIIGTAIGHEIGHAYDINGIKYGKNGNSTEISKEIMEMYYNRAECFLKQFNNYYGVTEADYDDTTPAFPNGSKGRITRGENMADTTGLHSVIEAYKKERAKHSNIASTTLPGFEKYTDDQLFFISFGSMWCEKATKEFEKMMELELHSPPRIRVIGTVSNSNDFAKAFNCPIGSPMNPEIKCNIWQTSHENNIKQNSTNFAYFGMENY